MIALNQTSRTPIYQQIIQQVLAQIACGLLRQNQQLPGVRSMAIDLGINPNTVMKAYAELERDGYIYSIAGKGSFVAETEQSPNLLHQKKLDEIKESLASSLPFGVTKDELMAIVEALYREEESV